MATTKFVAVLAQLKNEASPGPGFTTGWLDQLGAVVRQYWLDMSGGRQDIAWSVRPTRSSWIFRSRPRWGPRRWC